MKIDVLVKPVLTLGPISTVFTDESGMGFLLVILQDRLVQCLKVTSVAGNHSWGFADFEMGRLVMKRKHLRTDLTGVGLVTSLNKTRWVILIGWW